MSRYYVKGHAPVGSGNVFLTPERKEQAVAIMAETANLNEVCRRLGCTDKTIDRARKADPEFGRALADARDAFWSATPHDYKRYKRGCRCDNCALDHRAYQRSRQQDYRQSRRAS